MTDHLGHSGDWQLALSRAVEELQRMPVRGLTRRDRQLARVYVSQMERALSVIAGRCPDCLTPLGARHYCEGKRGQMRTFDEVRIPEGDPRRGGEYGY